MTENQNNELTRIAREILADRPDLTIEVCGAYVRISGGEISRALGAKLHDALSTVRPGVLLSYEAPPYVQPRVFKGIPEPDLVCMGQTLEIVEALRWREEDVAAGLTEYGRARLARDIAERIHFTEQLARNYGIDITEARCEVEARYAASAAPKAG